MFTGIIEKLGRVVEVKELPAQSREITLHTGFSHLDLGESVAVNGVCLTVTSFSSASGSGEARFFVGPDTLRCTNLGTLTSDQPVNLERSLAAQSRFSGHIVQGHVDGLAEIVEIGSSGESYQIVFSLPRSLSRYCVPKGSIALDGVSLTVQSLTEEEAQPALVRVMIIPHTWTHTRFSDLKLKSQVNVEVDILAKYVERLCHR